MPGEDTYPLFEESDWKALWGMARRHPQQKAAFLQLGNEMKAYDKAVWDNERNPDVLPPERLNLIDRISLIVNGGRLFSRDHESWKRIAEFVNGIRQQCEAARHERYVQFSREAPPAAPQSFSRSLDEIGPVEFSAWKEDEHPRGQPENAGEFKKYYRIQPAGLGLDHQSATSNGTSGWLHVFQTPAHVFGTEGHPKDYGDEVVEIEAPKHRDNGDVEGVEVNPKASRISRRWPVSEFPKAVAPWLSEFSAEDIDGLPHEYGDMHHWYAARNRHSEFELTPDEESAFHQSVRDKE
jgi:hypothetical protein